jgi:hypothetical protein
MASCKALHKGKARAINVPENSTVPVAWLRLSKQHAPFVLRTTGPCCCAPPDRMHALDLSRSFFTVLSPVPEIGIAWYAMS